MDIFDRINMRGNRIENCPDTELKEKKIIFIEAEKRENISSNEKVPIVFGKIAKWFTDLGHHMEDKIAHITKDEREKWDRATEVSVTRTLTTGTKVGTICIDGENYDLYCQTNTDNDTWKANTKDQEGYVAKGSGQGNKIWKTDAKGNPSWGKLSAVDVGAFPAVGNINNLSNISQINSMGFWAISAIESAYATAMGIDNNTGDFYALVLSYNGNGTDLFNFGTVILSSPRLGAYNYVITVWEGTAHAERMLNYADITQSSAVNIAGKKALDAIEKNAAVDGTLANLIQQLNSNLANIETHDIKILNADEKYIIKNPAHAWYNVKNGVCYFQVFVQCNVPMGYNQGVWYDTEFPMPKPLNGKPIYVAGGNYSDFADVLFIAIRSDTNFSLRLIGGVAEKNYMINGSYLINI